MSDDAADVSTWDVIQARGADVLHDLTGTELSLALARIDDALREGRITQATADAWAADAMFLDQSDDDDGVLAVADRAFRAEREEQIPDSVVEQAAEDATRAVADAVGNAGRAVARGVPWWGWVGGALVILWLVRPYARG